VNVGGLQLLNNLTPDLVVNKLSDIDLDGLTQRDIQALLLDVDNTICPWHGEEIPQDCRQWIGRALERFSICLVSNSIKPARLNRIAAVLGVPAVGRWGLGRKPLRGGIIEGLKQVQATPQSAAMIGDQLFADVLGGNRVGLYTVWVQPLHSKEFLGTKPARLLEGLLKKRFARLGIMPESAD